ncbi:MAG: TonB-dependent receptor [Ignavibacteriae bacterium]|nr:TonB-dependent receptor [Ignavibacteriota bacterium]
MTHRIFTLLIVSLVSFSFSFSQDYTGGIAGKVIDAATQEPLPGVNIVVVEKPNAGASSDANGTFRIVSLPVGTYSLRVSSVGYAMQIVTNVVVATGRQSPVSIKLAQTVIEGEEVTVEANYFTRAQQMSPLSVNVLDRAEIRRTPGAIQDVQRVVQALPGVASSTDNINELIVRGGAPHENLTVMDHMEIPSINHYSNQMNSAGPINMVNADMIEDVQFSAGGFPAQYGDKSSSVMNLTVREGNRNIGFSSNTGFNMAGMGTLIEGGLGDGKGSYIFSARNSLLEMLDKMIGLSSLSLTAIPKYWDTQGKIVYDLSPTQTLKFNFLYGDSKIAIEGDPKDEDELRKNVIDSSSVERVYPHTKQYVAGFNLQSLWGKNGYSVATLYAVGTSTVVDVFSDFSYRRRGPNGEVLDYQKLNSRPAFINNSQESFVGLKYELFYQPHARHELSLGGQIQLSNTWKNDVWIEGDTTRFDLDGNGSFEIPQVLVPQYRYVQEIGFAKESKSFAYVSDKFKITPELAFTLGLRYDYFSYPGVGNLSPRASLSYQIIPQITTLTLAAGRYPQTQPFPYFSDRRQLDYNKHLENQIADHIVLGIEHILDDGLKFSFEGYYKRYSKVAVSEDFIYSSDKTFWSDRFLTIGKRRSYGVELLLDKKQVKDFFGTVSFSLSKTEESDPRIPKKVDWYNSEYDYPVILTVIGGHVVRGMRDWLNDLPFFLKIPAYILPFSNEVEFSVKYRFQTGRPYTPKQYVTWKQFREGGVKWSQGAWIDSDNINDARYPNYSRVDFQWISRFYFQTWNINVYIALQNLLDTKNVFYENHRSDGTVETVYQFRFFPVGGVEVEF